jgi:hypothetical protein
VLFVELKLLSHLQGRPDHLTAPHSAALAVEFLNHVEQEAVLQSYARYHNFLHTGNLNDLPQNDCRGNNDIRTVGPQLEILHPLCKRQRKQAFQYAVKIPPAQNG